MQFFQQTGSPIIFDGDMGGSIDAALALGMLFGLDGKGEARVISVNTSRNNLKSAAFCEVIKNTYTANAQGLVQGGVGNFGQNFFVGLSTAGKEAPETPMIAIPLAKKDDKGAPVYLTSINKVTDTPDPVAFTRNALTAQQDNSCVIVLVGPATNMARLLALGGGKDWIAKKVKFLAVAAGTFPDGKVEQNVRVDLAAAKKLFAEWPTPIVAVGSEVGEAIPYPAASIENDFTWAQNHPLVDAYKAYKPMPYDAPASDLAAVLYAVHPDKNYFKLSEPGTISVLDDGRTKFTPSAQGKHRYLIVDPTQKDGITQMYRDAVSAKPVARQTGRRGGFNQKGKKGQQKQVDEKKDQADEVKDKE